MNALSVYMTEFPRISFATNQKSQQNEQSEIKQFLLIFAAKNLNIEYVFPKNKFEIFVTK